MSPRLKEFTRDDAKRVAAYLPIHLVVTAITWYDISHRPPQGVRGSKRLWQLAAGANTVGSIAYWVFGRKRY